MGQEEERQEEDEKQPPGGPKRWKVRYGLGPKGKAAIDDFIKNNQELLKRMKDH